MNQIDKKKIIFTTIAIITSFLIVDVGLQMVYFIKHKIPTWHVTEEFNMRDFIKKVDDDRYVTGVPNYNNSNYMEGEEGAIAWDIALDQYGFRIGANKVSTKRKNIVLIGDSVPFGWGVGSFDSVPSKLHEILQKKEISNIINAAIPSYSLDQAANRYIHEIHGKFPVSDVILQIYDPASQFAKFGKEWDVSINFTTILGKFEMNEYITKSLFLIKYSSLFYLIKTRLLRLNKNGLERLNLEDKKAFKLYSDSINKTLLNLYQHILIDDAQLFILPVTIPKKTWTYIISEQRKKSINVLNKTMRLFAQSNKNVFYIDSIELFNGYNDEDIFIDQCCHLSPYGARLLSELIAKQI